MLHNDAMVLTSFLYAHNSREQEERNCVVENYLCGERMTRVNRIMGGSIEENCVCVCGCLSKIILFQLF